jgi:hypothetical protein
MRVLFKPGGAPAAVLLTNKAIRVICVTWVSEGRELQSFIGADGIFECHRLYASGTVNSVSLFSHPVFSV